MPDNHDSEVALHYHNTTKHSYASVRNNQHSLDFNNQPIPFKIYPTLEPSPLPAEVRQSGVAALSAISETVTAPTDAAPDLEAIAQLLYLSAGITRHRKYPGGEIYFRAAACTGALYEVELYLVCGDLPNLEAGVYHFAAAEFGLRRLRAGDYRGVLIEATANEPSVAHSPLTIVCTTTYWRNAWKYQERTYRHFGWDNGTLLANLLAVGTALGLPAKVVCGFVDDTVNRLLDIDPQREVAFSLVPLGYASTPPAHNPRQASTLLDSKLFRSPAMRSTIRSCARCMLRRRWYRRGKPEGGAEELRSHTSRLQQDGSSSYSRYLTRPCLATPSNRSSCDADPAAGLPARRSRWRNSPPCSTAPLAVSLLISWIPRDRSSTTSI